MKLCKTCRHYTVDTDGEDFCLVRDYGILPTSGKPVAPNLSPLHNRSRWWLCGKQAKWYIPCDDMEKT